MAIITLNVCRIASTSRPQFKEIRHGALKFVLGLNVKPEVEMRSSLSLQSRKLPKMAENVVELLKSRVRYKMVKVTLNVRRSATIIFMSIRNQTRRPQILGQIINRELVCGCFCACTGVWMAVNVVK